MAEPEQDNVRFKVVAEQQVSQAEFEAALGMLDAIRNGIDALEGPLRAACFGNGRFGDVA
jgi:hypothetical protein